MPNPIIAALTARARRDGARPLLTWYRPADGGRTELSGKTFANWVDKTANLLTTLEVSGPVEGRVNLVAPGHWMSLLWPLAAWQHGCGYLAGVSDPSSDLVVLGPEPEPTAGRIALACSLHPLGLGLRDLGEGVLDFSGEALAEPDSHYAAPVAAAGLAWQDPERRYSHAEVGLVTPVQGRVLVRPVSAWQALAEAVLGPVLGGGSAVVVEGEADAETLARIAAAERVGTTLA